MPHRPSRDPAPLSQQGSLGVLLQRSLPRKRLQALRAAARVSRALGVPAYLIGGSVRDLLLGCPSPDLDLCVVGDGHAFARRLAAELSTPLTQDRRFLTAKIAAAGGAIDVATARRESYARPGALPRVAPGSIDDDLARRDFSVNAMALPLDPRLASQLLDPYGGRADLARRQLRVLHHRSFIDDPTRLLRAARYAARLRFHLEPSTHGLARQAVRADCLDTVSGDRIRRELFLLLDEPRTWAGVELCRRLGVLRCIHPGLSAGRRVLTGLRRISGISAWFSPGDGRAHPDCGLARLLVLADGLSLTEGDDLGPRLRLTARQRRALKSYLTAKGRVRRALSAPTLRDSVLVRALEPLPPEAVAALAATSTDRVRRRCRRFVERLRGVSARIRGDDLERLGFDPGPAWGRALAAARDARLDRRAASKDDEIRIAATILQARGARRRHR
ncbi:MAG: CCA tRNA nucleotidyltransferase [Armatimonadota bacterium]|nr:MAG: CCA tRNA nucleotidyltransferase [Armatimonadota bacterium]